MGIMDKIKTLITVPDDDYYADEENDRDIDLNADIPSRDFTRGTSFERSSSKPSYSESASARQSNRSRTSSDRSASDNKVVDIHTTAKLQVVLRTPDRYEEATEIADDLNEKRTVVLNLDKCNRDAARRIIDFLSGVAYANGGQPKKIAQNIFIITPYNVDVMGDLLDEIENNGFFFG